MSIPECLKEGMTALVFDQGDQQFMRESMEGMTVGGAITFPSGHKISAPPEGYVWHITNGECRTKKKNE